jgi:transcription elongation factor GreA-like protein
MAHTREFKIKRESCRDAYLNGKHDLEELGIALGVSEITIRKWIKAGRWDELYREEHRLDYEIKVARKKALIQALREYAQNPADTALQSLVSLIKHDQREHEPAKELNEYIIRFLDQTTDYMVEKGHESLLKNFQEILLDLAEYLRLKNG